jgi:hypothetical protein
MKIVKTRTVQLLFAFVLISLLFSSLLQRYEGHVMTDPDIDFYVYFFTSQLVHSDPHADLYEGATDFNPTARTEPLTTRATLMARKAGFESITYYLYPPLLADLFIPLTMLPPHVAAKLWRFFNLCLVMASVLLIARLCRFRALSSHIVVLALCAFAFWPINEAILMGQIAIAMLALSAASIVAYIEGWVILSAVILALATGLKITPIFLFPLFLIWKEKKWIVAYLTTLVALVLAMLAFNGRNTLEICLRVLAGMGGSIAMLSNKCIASLALWIHYGGIFEANYARRLNEIGGPTKLLVFMKIVGLAFYGVCLFLAWRRRHEDDSTSRATTMAIFSLVALIIAPVSWRHGYSVALIALAILWVRSLSVPSTILRLALLALTTFSVGSLFFDLVAQDPLPVTVRIICASVWTISCLLLCLEVLWNGMPQDSSHGLARDPASGPELTAAAHREAPAI